MGSLIDTVVADIRRGASASVYLLHGDELVAREGARAIVDALVPTDRQAWSVETISEDAEAATVPGRLRTVPLFGGTKVVVVHDTKAFTSKQNVGELFRKSWETWKVRDGEKAARGLLQAVAVAGQDRSFLERAAQGELPAALWKDLLTIPSTNESEQWLRETASHLIAEGSEIPEAAGAATAAVFEDLLKQGVPAGAVLILTAEVVDQRRALFKRIAEAGVVVDCGVRAGKLGETQMKPEVARARIAEAVHRAGKRIDDGATTCILDRTGFSVRTLESELEKILLYVGNRAEVRLADVLAVLSSSRDASIFDLTNAVESRDVAGALRALRALAGQREAAPALLGMIAATIRSLILARCALDGRLEGQFDSRMAYGGFQSRVVPRLAADAGPDDGSAAKLRAMHPFRAFNLLKAANRFRLADLLRGLDAIHQADLALKTTGQAEGVILETLVLTLCGGDTPKG
jgi:DNA polymerase-3 subunit delta